MRDWFMRLVLLLFSVMLFLRLAASSGSLYLNMLVLPSTMTQPWDSLTGESMAEAFTRQRAPGEGCRVAAPPSSTILQWRPSTPGPFRRMWARKSSDSSLVPITVSPSLSW